MNEPRIAPATAVESLRTAMYPDLSGTTTTLRIDSSFSRCMACGGNADPDEDSHIHGGRAGMTLEQGALSNLGGCGASFTEFVDQNGRPISAAKLARIREPIVWNDGSPDPDSYNRNGATDGVGTVIDADPGL